VQAIQVVDHAQCKNLMPNRRGRGLLIEIKPGEGIEKSADHNKGDNRGGKNEGSKVLIRGRDSQKSSKKKKQK